MEKMWILFFALIALCLYFWGTFIALAMFEVMKNPNFDHKKISVNLFRTRYIVYCNFQSEIQ